MCAKSAHAGPFRHALMLPTNGVIRGRWLRETGFDCVRVAESCIQHSDDVQEIVFGVLLTEPAKKRLRQPSYE